MFHEISFKSYDERTMIQGWIYLPVGKAKGVVQLVHGLGEHSRRYLHMIGSFNEAGYIVAADDHVAHGKTATVSGNWSDWGDKGYRTMMEDEQTLRTLVQEKYPELPYFMFGHSMGSFIVRDLVSEYGAGISGITICGTCGKFRNVDAGIAVLEKVVEEGKGESCDGEYTAELLGWMNERCDDVTIGNEWICHDPYVCRDHAEDPFNSFTKSTTNRSTLYFAQMMKNIEGTAWAEKVPKELPIYNIGGDQDPVGEYGKGIYEVANWLWSTGHVVKTKVYSGYRHEIHNYKEIREEVEQGVISFMNDNL
ncbi:MAG: alpha/beta hydrolase [Lachnospiraceae bacterium]|nr:alpha/beta hydrolase [Lachnospiraceae bacterium]